MWITEGKYYKVSIVMGLTALTLAIHYGWVFQPIFGHIHWLHALHGRFCYIPIVVAASWFGTRGGLVTAGVISACVLPYIYRSELEAHELAGETVEMVFYFLIAALTGALVEREFVARRKQQQAELQVERSQKLSLAGQIAAGVAHEIKNPLASIKGAADILVDNTASPEDKSEFKSILHREVRRIDSTVSEFLAFARPREPRLTLMNLSETVRACVKQTSAQSQSQDVRVEGRIDENVLIHGDAGQLHQMMLNLLLNAIQASQPGDLVQISLRLSERSEAVLEIRDTGTGVDHKDLERAFEPFFTTRATGTGLGLAIVKSIVESHNGKVTLSSGTDMGTAATVTLPNASIGNLT
ncbi:MAG: nitrogen regulation protein NR(II) [Candidatus Zixiibacteriota bacterium]